MESMVHCAPSMSVPSVPFDSALTLPDEEQASNTDTEQPRVTVVPVLVSVCLHAIVLWYLIDAKVDTPTPTVISSKPIQLQLTLSII